MGAIYSMLVLLLSKQHSPSISEITSSFFGLSLLRILALLLDPPEDERCDERHRDDCFGFKVE